MFKLNSLALQILDIIWKKDIDEERAKHTRKIIVYFTDEASHSALDGILGGILTPAGKLLYNQNT